jgi:catechol 2,3-dioxygenase-like lactoylglutathione lyase family enzyme
VSTLHHLALGTRDPETLAAFYRDVLDLAELDRHFHEDGRLRSVWLSVGDGVLMIEEIDTDAWIDPPQKMRNGLFLLAISIEEDERPAWERRLREAGCTIEERSQHTSYTRDPDGNRIAVSHYPVDG